MSWIFWGIVILIVVGFIKSAFEQNQSTDQDARSSDPPPGADVHTWPELGMYDFPVVGEGNYQPALTTLAGDHGEKFARVTTTATLTLEDNNPHDDKAVSVGIDGHLVGYLSRQDARSFRRRLGALKLKTPYSRCGAQICGGAVKDGQKTSYGVWLDIKPFTG